MAGRVQIIFIALTTAASLALGANDERVLNNRVDLNPAASERSFNYFTKNPPYSGYPQPTPYPSYPNYPSSTYPYPTKYPGYYPSTTWNSYNPNNYYPQGYYPNRYPVVPNKFDPSYWLGKMPFVPSYPNYPNYNPSYPGYNPNYPYYPNGGTNVIGFKPPGLGYGNGGYGGYQGNGGLLSYSGYNGYYGSGNYPGNIGYGYQNSRTTVSTPVQEYTPRYPAVVTPSSVSRDA